MRLSRETLMKMNAELSTEVEARIREGIFARVKRYVQDAELRKRLDLALRAQKAAK